MTGASRSTLSDRFADIVDISSQLSMWLWRPPFTWLRWFLFTAIPFVVGPILEDVVQRAYRDPEPFSSSIWFPAWPALPLVGLYALVLYWHRYYNYKARHADRLHVFLRHFYEDMCFGKQPEADIRCTIWTPIGRIRDKGPIKLVQVTDYVPRVSGIQRGIFRRNGRAWRVFTVARMAPGGEIRTIGILGLCAFRSLQEMHPEICREEVPADVDFEVYMTSNWHFTRRQAKRLTHDRRSYMCISLMDRGNTDLLGVLYCDSRQIGVFTSELAKRAEEHLPRFARLLTM